MINKAARIRAVGESTGKLTARGTCICKVKCQGCRKDILSDADLSKVEYVKTKRGTELFFHRGCVGAAWGQKIV